MHNQAIAIVSPPSLDLSYYLDSIVTFFSTHYLDFFNFAKSVIGFLIGISIPVSIMFFIGIIISVEGLKYIRKKEDIIFNSTEKNNEDISSDFEMKNKSLQMAKRWETILTHLESQNPNDWRHAILEADIILGDLLTELGYRGEGIGEQLQRVVRGDFKTLNEAWEAHKVRNEIAHSGSDFVFSQFEARRVINLYRKVFEEFFHI